MASEIGMKIAKHALVAHAQGRLDDPYQKALNGMAGESDRELQEVREVLEGLKGFDVQDRSCWCYSRSTNQGLARLRDVDDHDALCQRARALSERLRV